MSCYKFECAFDVIWCPALGVVAGQVQKGNPLGVPWHVNVEKRPLSTAPCSHDGTWQYGWSGTIADLDEEGQEMLLTAYSADPKWSSQVCVGRAGRPFDRHDDACVLRSHHDPVPQRS